MGNQSSIEADSYTTMGSPKELSSPMSLGNLVLRHSKHFPLVVAVQRVKKKSSRCEVSFREGHFLCAHFHKESEVVTVEAKDGARYTVPLKTSFLCSPLHNPEGEFDGVSRLLEQKPLPQIVYVTQGYLSPSGEESSSIEEGQVLAIKGMEFFNGKESLRCIDINSYEQKYLEADCNASFSTSTSLLKVTLGTLMDHISLPTSAIFFPPVERHDQNFPDSLACTILSQSIAQSVIASPYSLPFSTQVPNEVLEILVDAPIYVSVFSLAEEETQQLKEKTRKLLTMFSPSLIAEVVGNISTPVNTRIQTALFQCLDQDIYWSREFISQEMTLLKEHPDRFDPAMGLYTTTRDTYHDINDDDDDDDDDVYEEIIPVPAKVSAATQRELHQTIASLPSPPLDDLLIGGASPIVAGARNQWNKSPSLSFDASYQSKKAERVERTGSLHYPRQSFTDAEDSNKTDYSLIDGNEKVSEERNKTILADYSMSQVLDMLDDLNLSQYKDKFEHEQITGSLLLELDDEILQQDLGITTKLHRLKLLRVIDGRHSL